MVVAGIPAMLKILALLAAVALLATASVMGADEAQARDMAKIRACGGPARSYNQCLTVCGCMGGMSCFKRCGNKDFTNAGSKKGGGGKRAGKGGGKGGRR